MAKELEFGLMGFDNLTTGTSGVGAWVGIEAVNGAASFTAVTHVGDDVTTTHALNDGQVTYGSFTNITWVSGEMKIYRNVKTKFNDLD